MSVFVVASTRPPCEALKQEIERVIEDGKFYQLNDTAWAIDYEGTSKGLSDKLNIKAGGNASAVIFLVSSYSGYASRYLWEWLRSRPSVRSE